MTADWMWVGFTVALVLANAFFVATEMALVRARPAKLKALEEHGNRSASQVLRMTRRLDAVLSATQVGVTLASLGLGWVGEPAIAHLFEQGLAPWVPSSQVAHEVAHTVAIVVGFGLLTFLHIVLGELTPKSLAIQKAESIAMAVVTPMRVFYAVAYPFVWLLNRGAGRVLRLFGLPNILESESPHSEEELRQILTSSAEAGAIDGERAQLLARALEMTEKTARQVLVPRSQVTHLDLDEPLEKNIGNARVGGHTWLPVVRGNLDQVEGVVNVKDLFFLLANGQLKSIAQVQRPVLFVPENVTLEQLLAEFRRRRRQMAVVVDEHGGTSGIVTLADVVAEVVGDVAELGRSESEVKTLPGGRLELAGTTQLEDLEERLDIEFDVDPNEVTTIAGYLMAKLGRVPQAGDRVPLEEFEVRVLEMDGPRVMKVLIEPQSPPLPPSAPKVDA